MPRARVSERIDGNPRLWLTRGQVALVLAVSVTRVRELQRDGQLVSHLDARGRHRFERARVESLIEIRKDRGATNGIEPAPVAPAHARLLPSEPLDGETCARVYDLIAEGVPLPSIVTRMRLHPAHVSRLASQYADLGGGLFLDASALGRLAGIGLTKQGLATGEAYLQLCARCHEDGARFCASCIARLMSKPRG